MDFQSKFFEILLDDNFNFDLHSSSFAYFAASKCAKLFNFVLFKQNSIEKNLSRIRTRIAKIEGESSVDHHYHHGPLITILFGKCFKLKIKLRDLLVDQNGHFHSLSTTDHTPAVAVHPHYVRTCHYYNAKNRICQLPCRQQGY